MNVKRPSISIIMPVKNAGQFIKDCIESIIAQSFENWELITVNDGSEDSSLALLQTFAQLDPRIKVLENKKTGIISALITAFNYAKGEFVTRMDADDIMPKSRLKKMRDRIALLPSKTIVTGLVEYFAETPVSDGYLKYEKWINEVNLDGVQNENMYRECVIASPNWMARHEDLHAIEAFEKLNYPEDYDLVLKWFINKFEIEVIPEITLYWREHAKRTSRNSDHYQQKAFFKLKIEHFIEHQLKDKHLLLWGTGTKAKFTKETIDKHNVKFTWMGLKKGFADGLPIELFSDTKNYKPKDTLILLTIYPRAKEKNKLDNFLNQLHFHQGINYWYV